MSPRNLMVMGCKHFPCRNNARCGCASALAHARIHTLPKQLSHATLFYIRFIFCFLHRSAAPMRTSSYLMTPFFLVASTKDSNLRPPAVLPSMCSLRYTTEAKAQKTLPIGFIFAYPSLSDTLIFLFRKCFFECHSGFLQNDKNKFKCRGRFSPQYFLHMRLREMC